MPQACLADNTTHQYGQFSVSTDEHGGRKNGSELRVETDPENPELARSWTNYAKAPKLATAVTHSKNKDQQQACDTGKVDAIVKKVASTFEVQSPDCTSGRRAQTSPAADRRD
jgi:hypothetical protein